MRSADLGHHTLVLSIDLAHSLGGSLEVALGPEPKAVAPILWAQEPDVHYNLQRHWCAIQRWLQASLTSRRGRRLIADEVSIIPGMEELSMKPAGGRLPLVGADYSYQCARGLAGPLERVRR